jgi:hypothetical protein
VTGPATQPSWLAPVLTSPDEYISTAGTPPEEFSMAGKPLPTSLAGGADLQVVKERLGHAAIMTTQRYLHTLPDADETAVEAFSRIRHRTPATPSRGKGRSA